jgi:hydrogenase nickel incorporation protein HypA/HybF
MHEMTLAVSIVDLAVQTAEQNKAKQINKIAVEVGALAGVVRDALEFCFSEAVKNTMAENATLEYIHIPARATCESCGHQYDSDERASKCPKCSNLVFQLSGGTEFRVKNINVD